ncbi:hypothetical protein [Actinosynnema sp. NPDC023587]|uniref:hypothetical protein n=1 Tax=Actinosynnema sp. NPDC023587 TaxID=3154695 RepID=UPI0033EAFD4A
MIVSLLYKMTRRSLSVPAVLLRSEACRGGVVRVARWAIGGRPGDVNACNAVHIRLREMAENVVRRIDALLRVCSSPHG